ncbi:peroxisome biogenesis factor 2 isoform X1 [Ictalurus punctatus]|uniref:RING-type E3 ubiquitin transferase (cysteine targeting) n=1 Tax=Ictalurus punctatus TaxID=7998 RepID=A0A979EFX2_ICTPU|nr:peroxisome biogenesis factor 2 isoform X1 [Ictalurus punctatus]
MARAGSETSSPRVLRISQLDAFELDDALEQLVWSQFARCFQHFKPGLLTRVEPELKALLQLLVWRFTVYSSSATVGQTLLSIRYHNTLIAGQKYRSLSRRQKLWYALLTVGEKWLKERSHSLFLRHGAHTGLQKARQALALISSAIKVASLLNFMLFLQSGTFPTLTERMLGVRPVFVRDQSARQINFHFMNRELLWHGFAEFLIFLLPLINVWKLKTRLSALLSVPDRSSQKAESLRRSECGICSEWPVMPHSIGDRLMKDCSLCLFVGMKYARKGRRETNSMMLSFKLKRFLSLIYSSSLKFDGGSNIRGPLFLSRVHRRRK